MALGLALACVTLALLSVAATAQNLKHLGLMIGDHSLVFGVTEYVVLKVTAIVAAIAIYFLIYWLAAERARAGRVPCCPLPSSWGCSRRPQSTCSYFCCPG